MGIFLTFTLANRTLLQVPYIPVRLTWNLHQSDWLEIFTSVRFQLGPSIPVFWRARGFEILRVYSFPEIIVLDLTNFTQNDRSRLISWLFSTKNDPYYTSSLFSVNFFSDGYLDHTKNPCWNYQSIFFITPLFLLCIALIVWHLEERVEKRMTRGKLVHCASKGDCWALRFELTCYNVSLMMHLQDVCIYLES